MNTLDECEVGVSIKTSVWDCVTVWICVVREIEREREITLYDIIDHFYNTLIIKIYSFPWNKKSEGGVLFFIPWKTRSFRSRDGLIDKCFMCHGGGETNLPPSTNLPLSSPMTSDFSSLRTPLSRLDDEGQDHHLAHVAGDVVGIANTFERVQRTDVSMWFFGDSPVVFLAGSTAIPACTARAPLAVPQIEANNAETGCHD